MPYLGKSPSFGVRQRYQYTATAGQTTFSGTDTENLTLNYTDNNFVDVFQNGVLLKGGGTDYTATSGTSVVLATGASVSDVIEIIVYDAFSAGNFYSRTDSDSRYVRHDSGTLGTDNFIAGKNAGDAIVSGGNNNTLVGNEAGTSLTTGDNNVAVGFEALATEDADGNNVAVGYQALKTLNAGAEGKNTAVGYKAGTAITTGIQNTLMGHSAGMAITAGDKNTAIGFDALPVNTDSNRNTAVGKGTLTTFNVTDGSNTNNTAVGHDAGNDLTTGTDNTFIGAEAGHGVTTGTNNTFVGESAGVGAAGSTNTVVGSGAYSHTDAAGSGNTIMGRNAGDSLQSGGNNVIIGNGCDGAHDTSNGIALGVSVTVAANDFSFGKSGNVVTNDFDADANFSRSSDVRLKKNITDQKLGLDFINDLRTVKYNWKPSHELDSTDSQLAHLYKEKEADNEMNTTATMHNFIAQEVKTALDKAGVSDFGGWKEDQYGVQQVSREMFVIPLVKAVQELSAKNDALEARIKKLEDG